MSSFTLDPEQEYALILALHDWFLGQSDTGWERESLHLNLHAACERAFSETTATPEPPIPADLAKALREWLNTENGLPRKLAEQQLVRTAYGYDLGAQPPRCRIAGCTRTSTLTAFLVPEGDEQDLTLCDAHWKPLWAMRAGGSG